MGSWGSSGSGSRRYLGSGSLFLGGGGGGGGGGGLQAQGHNLKPTPRECQARGDWCRVRPATRCGPRRLGEAPTEFLSFEGLGASLGLFRAFKGCRGICPNVLGGSPSPRPVLCRGQRGLGTSQRLGKVPSGFGGLWGSGARGVKLGETCR